MRDARRFSNPGPPATATDPPAAAAGRGHSDFLAWTALCSRDRRSRPARILRGCAALLLLAAGGCIGAAGTRSRTWVHDSAAGLDPSDLVETRSWTPPGGTGQALELRRTADGRRFYACRAWLDVCGSVQAVCKPHKFDAFFREDGTFLGYRVEAGHPFTKAEHDPFLRRDYEHLDAILRDPGHAMGDLPAPRKASRPGEAAAAGIDGVTGATVAHYAERAVPKAFYTTHAIWHLVNVALPPVLQKWTLAWAGPAEVRDWVARGEPLKAWWYLDRVESAKIGPGAAADLAYEMLAATNRQVQAAALRHLRRAGTPFRADACRARDYTSLPDETKSAFLDWWAEANHTDDTLDAALRTDLAARAAVRSPVATAILSYLQRTGLRTRDPAAWRATLGVFARETPSTFLRTKANLLADMLPAAP
jgi:hypothetical protein